jgi:tRNA A37 threonylcarbamoyladenosine dehydratase
VGDDGLARLQNINVLIVGLGGVGGFAAEFLCRAGVGAMTIVDGDEVDPSNRNRQVLALRSTQGHPKARVLAQRLLDINPALKLTEVQVREPDT